MRSRGAGWILWVAIVFGLFNSNLRHADFGRVDAQIRAKQWPGLIPAIRGYCTNDGDIRRYFSYVQAALGRPYQSYFVRSAETWREQFAANEPYRPDELPILTPPHPLMPYRDYLIEYPPGFFLATLPPALLTSSPEVYTLLFQCFMGAALTAALLLMSNALAAAGRPIRSRALMAWGALAVFSLGIVSTHRFDAAVALNVAVMAWGLARRRPIAVGAALGVAIAIKITPLLLAPLVAMQLIRERRLRDLGKATGAAVLAIAILWVPTILTTGPRVFETLRYHADRPIQIESTWGGILGLVHAVAPGLVTVAKTFGSVNLVGPFGDLAATLSNVTLLAALALVYAVTWRRLRNPLPGQRTMVTLEATAATFATFMVFGKLCSPQYFVWVLPLGLALSLARRQRTTLALFIAILVTTQVIYPVTYGLLSRLRWPVCLLVVGRNLLFLTWAILLFRDEDSGPSSVRLPEQDEPFGIPSPILVTGARASPAR